MRSILQRFGVLLLAAICATACQGDNSSEEPERPVFAHWPQSLDGLRFRWTAEPGIDLLTGPAVPLRAYIESHRTGDFTLDPENVYPGFQQAVHPGPPNTDKFSDAPYELWYIQPFTDPRYAFGPASNFYGNEYFHILSLEPDDDGWRAYVCDGTYGVFREGERTDAYVPVNRAVDGGTNPDDSAMNVWRVELTDKPDSAEPELPSAVNSPQEGPLPAPTENVFGPWRITGASPSTTWGPSNDPNSGPDTDYLQKQQQCLARMPHSAAQRQEMYASEPTSPPEAEPAVPGWPEAPSQ